jgi:hypothetical protein
VLPSRPAVVYRLFAEGAAIHSQRKPRLPRAVEQKKKERAADRRQPGKSALLDSRHQRVVIAFLLVAILIVAADKKLMQGQPSSRLGWFVVAIITVAMFAAGVAMFVV